MSGAISNISALGSTQCRSIATTRLRSALDFAGDKIATAAFLTASYLTDPLCKSHECYRRMQVVEALHPTAGAISKLARKVLLATGALGCAAVAAFTTLPGIALRALGASIQTQPFIHVHGEAQPKVLPPDRSFSLLSWNICGIGAGYPISDGGVLPLSFRLDAIANKILEQDADVNCLYETFDVRSAFYICEKLKRKGYSQFYFNIKPQAVGVSSGIFVASKYHIQNPEFTAFPQASLLGRTQYTAKGVFSCDLKSGGGDVARVYTTHMQHSSTSEFPTTEEIAVRKIQMQLIVDKINTVRDRCVVVTGDLNLDDREYEASSWRSLFDKGDAFGAVNKTWGGDGFCARLMGIPGSNPLNLDHTMVLKNTASSISTSLVPAGFDANVFKAAALSDHNGLLSRIVVRHV